MRPAAIGPYSQAIKAGGFVFASGQIPIDPQTGQFVAGRNRGANRACFEEFAGVLEAAGSSLDQVVKTTVFLADMKEFSGHERSLCDFLFRTAAGEGYGCCGWFAA